MYGDQPKTAVRNSIEFGKYRATLLPPIFLMCSPITIISFVIPLIGCSMTSSFPMTVRTLGCAAPDADGVPKSVAEGSGGSSPVTLRQMSRKSPSLPEAHAGAPGDFTLRPVRSGYP